MALADASTVAYLVTSPLSPKDKAAPSLKERLGEGKLPE